jgi:hypothetical protein
MSEELKITKERVLKAAEGCPDVKRALKTLFPEAFEDDTFVKAGDITAHHDKIVVYLPTEEVETALKAVQRGDKSFVTVLFDKFGRFYKVECWYGKRSPIERAISIKEA